MFPTHSFDRLGAYTGSDELQATMAREGFVASRRKANAVHQARVREAARFMGALISGEEDPVFLREALMPSNDVLLSYIESKYPGILGLRETMSVTDFSNYLTVDVLDRMLYGYYTTQQIPVLPLVKRVTLRDFRSVKRFEVDGAVAPFNELKHPATPPEQRTLTAVAPITYAPSIYAGSMSISWKAIVNDDLGIFNDMVQRLAESWKLTIWKAITSLYMGTSGPSSTLYTAGFRNLITTTYGAASANPPLSFQGLADGYTVLLKQLSTDSQPISFTGKLYLWCTPYNAVTAKALKSALRADISVLGGKLNASGFPETRLNVDPSQVLPEFEVIVDPYIPIICTGDSTAANTAWGLMYDPNTVARPAIEFGQLRGFDTPQLYQKLPNTQRVGGGVDPTMGDWLTMDTDYKAIAVYGGTVVDGRSTVASTGKAS